jgi:hypothetical protein
MLTPSLQLESDGSIQEMELYDLMAMYQYQKNIFENSH